MQSLSFLPTWPPVNWELVMFAALLLAGFAAGELLRRARLPRLTGYILVGLLLGDSGLRLIDVSVQAQMRVFIDVGLGLLLFELGQRLDLQWMRRERWLWVTSLGEIGLTWLLVFAAMHYFGFSRLESAMLASVAISTSPLVVMALVRELGADGQVSSRVLSLSALNSLASFVLLAMLLAGVHLEYAGGLRNVLLHPVYLLFGSFALGGLVFVSFRAIARWIGKESMAQFALAISMILLAVGLAVAFKLSVLTTLLTLGVLTKNADPERRIRHIDFGIGMELFFVFLFIGAGAAIQPTFTPAILYAALALIAMRLIGKTIPVYAIAGMTPLGIRRAGYVSLALTPLSGFAALLVLDTSRYYAQVKPELIAVVLTSVAILELAGPLLTNYALRRSGETRPDA